MVLVLSFAGVAVDRFAKITISPAGLGVRRGVKGVKRKLVLHVGACLQPTGLSLS